MTTNANRTIAPARDFPQGRVIQVLRKIVLFNDPYFTTGMPFEFGLPLGARIVDLVARKLIAFNAGVLVNVGVAVSDATIMPTADIAPQTVGASRSLVGVALAAQAADVVPFVTGSGSAATAGSLEIEIMFERG